MNLGFSSFCNFYIKKIKDCRPIVQKLMIYIGEGNTSIVCPPPGLALCPGERVEEEVHTVQDGVAGQRTCLGYII